MDDPSEFERIALQCATTHSQIARGTCPWCGDQIAGEWQPEKHGFWDPRRVQWNVDAIRAAINSGETAARFATLRNLSNWPSLTAEEMIPLLSAAIDDQNAHIRGLTVVVIGKVAHHLDEDEAPRWERELQGSAHEAVIRNLLLRHYSKNSGRTNQQEMRRHLVWFIENYPDSEFFSPPLPAHLGSLGNDIELKQLWLRQVDDHPGNTMVLQNAATFFLFSDRKLAIELFAKLCDADSENPNWRRLLDKLREQEQG